MRTINKKPGAWVCTNENERQTRGRTKTYQPGSKIFLNDGEEFEIELHNPTTDNVKAEIEIDGKPIVEGGLVLRSGQRVYLECFPDSKKKFTFKTYEVENTKESKEATANNGRVSIKFYREHFIHNFWVSNNCWDRGTYITPNLYTSNYPYIAIAGTLFAQTGTTNLNTLTNHSVNTGIDGMLSEKYSSNIETGQVDGGQISTQNFGTTDMTFETWVLSSYSFQLLPMSHKPADVQEFKTTSKKNKSVNSKADELLKLKILLEAELLTEEEFHKLKEDIIQ